MYVFAELEYRPTLSQSNYDKVESQNRTSKSQAEKNALSNPQIICHHNRTQL